MALTHAFTSAIADGADATLVRPSNWNADHAVSGTSLQVLFNNATSLTGMAGTSWDDTNRSLTLTGATVTTSNPILNLSQTWNAGAVAFTALKLNVTNTASAAGSKFLDAQLGGTTKIALGFWDAGGANYQGLVDLGGNSFHIRNSGSSTIQVIGDSTFLYEFSNLYFALNPNTGVVRLSVPANHTLEQRNGTNAQTLRVYNTYTDASNYERGVFDWSTTANTLTIGAQAAGTGTLRDVVHIGNHHYFDVSTAPNNRKRLQIYTDGNDALISNISGGGVHLLIQNYGTGSGRLRLGSSSGLIALCNSAIAGDDAITFNVSNIAAGQKVTISAIHELTTIAAAATTDTAMTIPAGVLVFAVSVRTVTTIPTASTYTVTGAGSSTVFDTAAVSTTSGATDPGTAAGVYYNASAQAVRITPDLTPATATGQVRVTVHYIQITPPTG